MMKAPSSMFVDTYPSPKLTLTSDQNNVTCLCTGSQSLFVGSSDGTVQILSRSFKVLRSFKAADHGSIMHMKQIENTSLLVTIAEDLSSEPVLKVWALDKTEKKSGSPRCLSTTAVQNGRRLFPVGQTHHQLQGTIANSARYRHLLRSKTFPNWRSASPTAPLPSSVAT